MIEAAAPWGRILNSRRRTQRNCYIPFHRNGLSLAYPVFQE